MSTGDDIKTVVKTPLFPTYSEVQRLMVIWRDAVTKSAVLKLINALWDQSGTPQDPVDWSEPDKWIDERLNSPDRDLAKRIWLESDRKVNPRHLYGSYLFVNTHKVLMPDVSDIYRAIDVGEPIRRFVAQSARLYRAHLPTARRCIASVQSWSFVADRCRSANF